LNFTEKLKISIRAVKNTI